jgi:integral membrane protein (TIGR01906 family)
MQEVCKRDKISKTGRLFYWSIISSLPIFVVLTALLITSKPWITSLIYNIPYFPDDPFGFSVLERTHYAKLISAYLSGNVDYNVLSELHFQINITAQNSSDLTSLGYKKLFGERELKHLIEVRTILSACFLGWYAILLILISGFIVSWRYAEVAIYFNAIERGSKISALILSIIILASIWFFMFIFDGLHELLFSNRSWIFPPTDTLIRLFPEEYWEYIFGMLTVLSLFISLSLFTITHFIQKYFFKL